MSLILTFVFHVKILNLDGALDCQMSFSKKSRVDILDNVERKKFIGDLKKIKAKLLIE